MDGLNGLDIALILIAIAMVVIMVTFTRSLYKDLLATEKERDELLEKLEEKEEELKYRRLLREEVT